MANTDSRAPTGFTKEDGAVLAMDLLTFIQATPAQRRDQFRMEAHWRLPGEPQKNVAQQFLDQIRESGSRPLEEGFTAVLTHYLSACVSGLIPDIETFEAIIDAESL